MIFTKNTTLLLTIITVYSFIFILQGPARAFTNDSRYGSAQIKIVSGFAKNVGYKKKNHVMIKTVPKGKRFILTDIVADRAIGSFKFNISGRISLSININEYKVDQSPQWHFFGGIPFKSGEKIVINKEEGYGNVFISGYLIDAQ